MFSFTCLSQRFLSNLRSPKASQVTKRCHYWRMSQMFPMTVTESDKFSKDGCQSQKLMTANHIIHGASAGSFHMLPWGTRALEKLYKVIDRELQSISCQKISMPCLAPGKQWKASGRWEEMGSELLKLEDRKSSELCLAPTHEEAVTSLVASLPLISYKSLPLKWYQIGRKFRDEMRPKNGLLRCREFEMKDLYTFDIDEEHSKKTYEEILQAYLNIFKQLGLSNCCIQVEGHVGAMGGSISHEFHLVSDIGEDVLVTCSLCGKGFNKEVYDKSDGPGCSRADCSQSSKHEQSGIEVAHAFVLGTKYTDVFQAKYKDADGSTRILNMGCYGIGLTRLLAAGIEVLSTEDQIRWPTFLAPYLICIIPQKDGYQADVAYSHAEDLASKLTALPHLQGEVVIDDRTKLSIGKRLMQAKQLGFPCVIVAGKTAQQSPAEFEFIDVYNNSSNLVSSDKVLELSLKYNAVTL